MNKCFCMVAVSVVCLCGTAHALTEAWHVSLTNTSGAFLQGGCQVIPDGSGGVACSYTLNSDTNVIQWVNAQGHQIYSCALSATNINSLTIIGLDKSHLVYSIDPTGCVVVDKLGRETHVANSQIMTGRDFQPLQNDKNGFFIIRYTGDGADGELVRFLYK